MRAVGHTNLAVETKQTRLEDQATADAVPPCSCADTILASNALVEFHGVRRDSKAGPAPRAAAARETDPFKSKPARVS
jgi:hypothetical protein